MTGGVKRRSEETNCATGWGKGFGGLPLVDNPLILLPLPLPSACPIVSWLFLVQVCVSVQYHHAWESTNGIPLWYSLGGHTYEMLRLLEGLAGDELKYTSFVVAATDTLSQNNTMTWYNDMQKARKETWYDPTFVYVPRAREVGQSYLTALFMTLYATLVACYVVWILKPEVILLNGPGTCIPLFIAGLLSRFLCWRAVRIVYVESICRVTTLSTTAKLIYPFARVAPLCPVTIFVQWPQLAAAWPATHYRGRML
jgi:beta-1,4-N-acetylglucosaminyltransferase